MLYFSPKNTIYIIEYLAEISDIEKNSIHSGKNNENCNFKFWIWHNTLLKETTDSISAFEMTKLRKKVGSVKKWTLAGVIIGVAAVLLTVLGNPGNMGFCIACEREKGQDGCTGGFGK